MRTKTLTTAALRHAGSKDSTRALLALLVSAGHEIVGTHRVGTRDADFRDADFVVCNGEGTIHHDQPCAMFLRDALARAQSDGRKTALVNTVFDGCAWSEWRDVLSGLDVLAARDPWSRLELIRCASVHVGLYGDLSLYMLDKPEPAERTVPEAWGDPGACPNNDFRRLFDGDQGRCIRVRVQDFQRLQGVVDALAHVRRYVTGQYHGVIAAWVAGVPDVRWEASNSWKIQAFEEWRASEPMPLMPADLFALGVPSPC